MNQIKKVVTEMANNVRKLRKDMKDADKKHFCFSLFFVSCQPYLNFLVSNLI